MTRAALLLTLLVLSLATPAAAQPVLTLDDAIAGARQNHPDVRRAEARHAGAVHQVTERRAGLLPRVDLSEGWQQSDLPVFAFSSLLSQRRFTADDFAIGRLNRPGAIDNFRAAVVVEQSLFDATLRAAIAGAGLDADMAGIEREHVAQQVAVATVEAYGRVLFIEAMVSAADAAVDTALADLRRATDRRDAGVATDADVLLVTAHLSAMRERQVEATAGVPVARAQLNYLLGKPLDELFTLAAMPVPETPVAAGTDEETRAVLSRPDVRLSAAAADRARLDIAAARSAFLPQLVARGAAEWNGATFAARERGWMVGAELRVDVFRGFADSARLARARAVADQRDIERGAAEDRARLDVRATAAALAAAAARVDLSREAVSAAREGHRITRDRYDNGLADITVVLHAANAVLDAEAGLVAAESDRATSHARLQAALGN